MASGTAPASFVYNADGLRVQKTVNGVVTNYTLHGKNVVHMTCDNNELHFFYDAANKPAVVVYNGTAYAYVKNLQGDIIAILDANGNVVVQYAYDAWGKPIATTGSMASTLGVINPFRYRGYVYDQETGLYYLRSRYFQPLWSKFIILDAKVTGSPEPFFGHSGYVYCGNNPTKNSDPNGEFLNCILGGVIGGAVGALTAMVNGENVLAGAITGAVTGAGMGLCADIAIATGGVGALAMAAGAGGAINAIGNAVNALINGNEVTLESLTVDFVVGGLFNALTFGVGGGTLTKTTGKLWDNLCKGLFDSAWKHAPSQVAKHLKAKNIGLLTTWLFKSLAEEVAICTFTSGGTVIFSEAVKELVE